MPDAYKLPERLRSRLAKPLGRFFTAEQVKGTAFAKLVTGSEMVVTVGDKVTETAFGLGRTPDVQVVDGMERRMKREPPDVPYATLIRVKNPAGVLTKEAIMGVRAAFRGRKPARVLVDGEEDLVAIPVISEAPATAVVLYGQPGEGIVAVRADARTKARNRAFLAEMGITDLG